MYRIYIIYIIYVRYIYCTNTYEIVHKSGAVWIMGSHQNAFQFDFKIFIQFLLRPWIASFFECPQKLRPIPNRAYHQLRNLAQIFVWKCQFLLRALLRLSSFVSWRSKSLESRSWKLISYSSLRHLKSYKNYLLDW